MIKYFIFTFLFIWAILTFIFYQDYKNSIQQHHKNQYVKLLDKYELAMELASSKLNNIHLHSFLKLNLSNVLEQFILNKNIKYKTLLDNELSQKISQQNFSFDNIVIYNKNGEQLYSLKGEVKTKSYGKDFLTKVSKCHEILFESIKKDDGNFIIVSPIYSYKNNIIGFFEKSISFKKFNKNFLEKIPYTLTLVEKNIKKDMEINEINDIFYIKIYPYNKNEIFTLKFVANIPISHIQKVNLYKKSFYTFFILLIIFYMFYSRFNTIEKLRTVGHFMEKSNDQLLVVSMKNNHIEFVNLTFLKNTNYLKKEVLGKNINLFIPKEYLNKYNENIKNNVNTFKSKFIRKDNSTYDVEIHMIKTDTNTKTYMCIVKDISKEKSLYNKIELQKEFFKTIIESSPSGIFVKNTQSKYLLANNAMAKAIGLDNKEQLLNKTNIELNLPVQLCTILSNDETKSLEQSTPLYKEIQKIKDKYYKIILIPLYHFSYPVNENMVLGFITDITSEIEKKNELAKLNTKLKMEILEEIKDKINIDEKFKTIFNNIHDGMFVYNINEKGELTKLVSKNKAAKEFLDIYNFEKDNPNEIFEKLSFNYNKDIKNFETHHHTFIKKLNLNNIEHSVKIDAQLIEIAKEYKVIIFVQNIDEKIKLKKEKREQQILIANIFKKAKAGIAIIDKDGKLIKYNQSFYKILGYKRNEFRKQSFYLISSKDYQKTIQQEHKELFRTKKEIAREYTFISKDEKEINVFASSTLIKDGFNEIFRLFIFEDITKLKELELEQMKNSKIIAQQAKMAEMGEMIGAIAHQWRQPLNAINAAAMNINFASKLDMLKQDDLIDKTEFIEKQSIKMSETINDFMNFFKPSKNKSTFSLENIYENICEFIDPQLKSRNIELSLQSDKDIIIHGFKNEFEHILLNLVNNAKDAFDSSNNPDKFIKIVGTTNQKRVKIRVIDNAGGIPNSILNKIFNPYFTTKEQGKGTGIGLYMTKTIIEQHFKGQIDVSNSDDGAIFTISLNVE